MAKRFTDTGKWKKPFLKSLPPEYKLFYLYLLDECDHAGIWPVELDVAESRLGVKLSHENARRFFEGKIVEFDGGTKWFIPDFIEFQYGVLKEENRAHNSVIQLLNKYKLMKKNKPLTSPLQGAKDKDKDIDKEEGGLGETYTEEQLNGWREFKAWAKENASRIFEMKEPLTIDQYFKATAKYGKIGKTLKNMHNYRDLMKNVSAYLTLCNWMERERSKI